MSTAPAGSPALVQRNPWICWTLNWPLVVPGALAPGSIGWTGAIRRVVEKGLSRAWPSEAMRRRPPP